MKTENPKLAYTVHRAKDGVYVARIPALHLVVYGGARLEAIQDLVKAESEAIEIEKAMGNKIPTYAQSVAAIDGLKRGGARRGAGRKKGPVPARTERITFSVAPADKIALRKRAKASKKPLATFIYDMLMPSEK